MGRTTWGLVCLSILIALDMIWHGRGLHLGGTFKAACWFAIAYWFAPSVVCGPTEREERE